MFSNILKLPAAECFTILLWESVLTTLAYGIQNPSSRQEGLSFLISVCLDSPACLPFSVTWENSFSNPVSPLKICLSGSSDKCFSPVNFLTNDPIPCKSTARCVFKSQYSLSMTKFKPQQKSMHLKPCSVTQI